jgi:hypothetical protein
VVEISADDQRAQAQENDSSDRKMYLARDEGKAWKYSRRRTPQMKVTKDGSAGKECKD